MEIIKLSNFKEIDSGVIARIMSVIKADGVVAFPSDTVYGFLGRVDPKVISRIDTIKGRLPGKNYALILNKIERLNKLVSVPDDIYENICRNTPGLFTFVVKPSLIIDSSIKILTSETGTLGFRVPESLFMREVASRELVLATSANLSGQLAVYSLEELRKQLGDVVNNVDLIIDCPISRQNLASTVVDLSVLPPKILRQGSGKLK